MLSPNITQAQQTKQAAAPRTRANMHYSSTKTETNLANCRHEDFRKSETSDGYFLNKKTQKFDWFTPGYVWGVAHFNTDIELYGNIRIHIFLESKILGIKKFGRGYPYFR